MIQLCLDGSNLTIEQVHLIAHSSEVEVSLSPQALKKMRTSREMIDRITEKNEAVYGINTGFGALADQKIEKSKLSQLQLNLIRSHCTGVGEPFDILTSRAIMLLRANCLIQGHSGITPEIVELLLDFLNHNITPVIPQQGSVGASGDLAPLSHIALALIGEGDVFFQEKRTSSRFALEQIDRTPAKLFAKDGLALINGTAVMAALGALCTVEARKLAKISDISAALTLEAVRGTSRAYDERISQLKPHRGQLEVSKNLNLLLQESEVSASHSNCGKVQDPYSLRCVPQVHGSCRQTIYHSEEVLEIEINSVTDNPLVFVDDQEVISGGNFHGEALALSMDYLAMGLAELANISERRVEKMMNPHFSDLPSFLTENSGLNSGLMIAHVTMAALVSENKGLCHPASVDSIPTSTDKEDHVSMGVTSGRKLYTILKNLKYCLAIELLCNTQGLDFLLPLKTSPGLLEAYKLIRNHVEPIKQDRVFSRDIEKIKELIDSNELLNIVEDKIGLLS